VKRGVARAPCAERGAPRCCSAARGGAMSGAGPPSVGRSGGRLGRARRATDRLREEGGRTRALRGARRAPLLQCCSGRDDVGRRTAVDRALRRRGRGMRWEGDARGEIRAGRGTRGERCSRGERSSGGERYAREAGDMMDT
jgi:hypothetical protein